MNWLTQDWLYNTMPNKKLRWCHTGCKCQLFEDLQSNAETLKGTPPHPATANVFLYDGSAYRIQIAAEKVSIMMALPEIDIYKPASAAFLTQTMLRSAQRNIVHRYHLVEVLSAKIQIKLCDRHCASSTISVTNTGKGLPSKACNSEKICDMLKSRRMAFGKLTDILTVTADCIFVAIMPKSHSRSNQLHITGDKCIAWHEHASSTRGTASGLCTLQFHMTQNVSMWVT